MCQACHSRDVEWYQFSGRGQLSAFTCISVVPNAMGEKGFGRNNPYCSGIVTPGRRAPHQRPNPGRRRRQPPEHRHRHGPDPASGRPGQGTAHPSLRAGVKFTWMDRMGLAGQLT